MNLSNWRSQIRKGLIEFCLLNIIFNKGQAYGLELLEGLNSAHLKISEGTIYPLLSRLVREKYLQPNWETPESGNPRKYYKLSPLGLDTLVEMQVEWSNVNAAVNEFTQEIRNLGRENDRSKSSAEA